jgi:hypothetical protein
MSDRADVQVVFGADISGLLSGIAEAQGALEEFGAGASGISQTFTELAEGVAAAFAVDKIGEFTEHFADLGTKITAMEAEFGLTGSQVQELGYAMEAAGGNSDSMSMAMLRMSRAMAEAQQKDGPQSQALERLGITYDQLGHYIANPYEGILKIADAVQDSTNKYQTNADMMTVFGRGVLSLLPAFQQGSSGIEEMGVVAERTGNIMSDAMVAGAHQSHEALTELGAATEGVGLSLFNALKPNIDATVIGLTHLVEAFNDSAQHGGTVGEVLSDLSYVFAGFQTSIITVVAAIEVAWNTFVTGIEEGGILVRNSLAAINDAMHGNFSQAGADLAAVPNAFDDAWKKGFSNVTADAKEWASQMDTIWDQVGTNLQNVQNKMKGTNPDAPPGAGSLVTQADTDNTLQQLNQQYEYILATDKLQIDEDKNNKQAMLADWDQYVNDVGVLYGTQSAKYVEAQQQMLNATRQTTQQGDGFWTQMTNDMGRNFDSMIQGVMQGTQSIQQVFERLTINMVTSFIESVGRMIAEWAVFEATTGQGFGKFGKTNPFGDIVGNLFGGASSATGDIATTANTTAVTADTTAVTGNTAAMIANTAALGASGGAGGIGDLLSLGKLPMFAEGSNNVPFNMLAGIHAGEMIIPAAAAEVIRSGGGINGSSFVGASSGGGKGGDGGDQYNFTIQAIDTQTGAQFLQNNVGTIINSFAQAKRNGNSTLANMMS